MLLSLSDALRWILYSFSEKNAFFAVLLNKIPTSNNNTFLTQRVYSLNYKLFFLNGYNDSNANNNNNTFLAGGKWIVDGNGFSYEFSETDRSRKGWNDVIVFLLEMVIAEHRH